MKKKAFLIIAVSVILVGALFIFKEKKGVEKGVSPALTPTTALLKISKDVEVNLTSRYDKKAVILKIRKIPPKTVSIDYELSYETEKGLPRGVLGTIRLKDGEGSIEREILLGTCSRNVCVYDTGVKSVNLVLKFNSAEGSSQFQKEYKL